MCFFLTLKGSTSLLLIPLCSMDWGCPDRLACHLLKQCKCPCNPCTMNVPRPDRPDCHFSVHRALGGCYMLVTSQCGENTDSIHSILFHCSLFVISRSLSKELHTMVSATLSSCASPMSAAAQESQTFWPPGPAAGCDVGGRFRQAGGPHARPSDEACPPPHGGCGRGFANCGLVCLGVTGFYPYLHHKCLFFSFPKGF